LLDAIGDDGSPSELTAHPWAASLTFLAAGALLIGLGLFIARRRRTAIPGADLL
jgi:LPXTG-motif cell wall-anchored protein